LWEQAAKILLMGYLLEVTVNITLFLALDSWTGKSWLCEKQHPLLEMDSALQSIATQRVLLTVPSKGHFRAGRVAQVVRVPT
jgi:hypothetical protein